MLCSCWNNYFEILLNIYMVNRNWKCWVVSTTYCTRWHKEFTNAMDIPIHSDAWSLFIVAFVKQNVFTWIEEYTLQIKWNYRCCILPNHRWIPFAVRIEQTPNKGNAFGRISPCTHKSHIHKYTKPTNKFLFDLMKAANYEALHYILFSSFQIPYIWNTQIIYCLRPIHQIPWYDHLFIPWRWRIHVPHHRR
jgi:hypothetical protein